MPELPEVEVVRRGLTPALAGAEVLAVERLDPRTLRRQTGGAAEFAARLTGARLDAPRRRGKFLWVPLAGAADALVLHLGMSGQVLVDPGPGALRHHRARIRVRTPAGEEHRIDFVDQRTFGYLVVDEISGGVPSLVSHIAPDPLEPAFDEAAFVRRIRAKRTEVKRALLDQTLVSGIGNIYADEALWAARVHPRQPTETLSRVAARRLLGEVRAVMERALAEGGTSFDDLYVDVNGRSGYFERSLRAYGQGGRPCGRCGRPIVRETFMNRGSHYCPGCQRIRRG